LIFSEYSDSYAGFWPVASIKVYKVYPVFEQQIRCPLSNCTYFEIYDSGQNNIKEYSTFVSICKQVKVLSKKYQECEIGKLAVGVKIKN
jgi:ribosome-associated toxin RatA of RatAB toxin-antitoxin module